MPEGLVRLQSGYLAMQSVVKEIHCLYSKFLSTFLDYNLSKITLPLTQNCNFRCKYRVYSEAHNNAIVCSFCR